MYLIQINKGLLTTFLLYIIKIEKYLDLLVFILYMHFNF